MAQYPVTVVKIGGSLLGQTDKVISDIVALHAGGERFVLVHGGSRTITEWSRKILGHEAHFVDGLRKTTPEVLDIVVAVLSLENKRLVTKLQSKGVLASGLTGADAAILHAVQMEETLGRVGTVTRVDTTAIESVLDSGAVAVLAPFAIEAKKNGNGFHPRFLNVNADTAAGAVAEKLGAAKLVMFTDVDGVQDEDGNMIEYLSASDALRLIDTGGATHGMIPKLAAAVHSQVRTVIVNGSRPNALVDAVSLNGATPSRLRRATVIG